MCVFLNFSKSQKNLLIIVEFTREFIIIMISKYN